MAASRVTLLCMYRPHESLGGLVKMHPIQWVLGWSLTVCASNKLPDAAAAAPWTTLT